MFTIKPEVMERMKRNEQIEKELFQEVFDHFAEKYPHRKIHLNGTLVVVDGKVKFNIEGYNLLFNLQRMCNSIKEELI